MMASSRTLLLHELEFERDGFAPLLLKLEVATLQCVLLKLAARVNALPLSLMMTAARDCALPPPLLKLAGHANALPLSLLMIAARDCALPPLLLKLAGHANALPLSLLMIAARDCALPP